MYARVHVVYNMHISYTHVLTIYSRTTVCILSIIAILVEVLNTGGMYTTSSYNCSFVLDTIRGA